jgi:ubiquinone/menaquinone biosynthesis C-methylase UbiE
MEYVWDYLDKRAYNNNTGFYKTQRQFDFILKNLKPQESNILDIAGGAGRFAIPLTKYSKNITVVDINEKAIHLLNERNKDIRTICCDFANLEIKDKYSLILCIEALPYFDDWQTFFSKINSLLSRDGQFIFTYTNPHSWRYLLRKLKNRKKSNPYTEMRIKDIKALMEKNNLIIQTMEGMNWMPFSVVSNSPLVNLFSSMEKILGLHRWHAQSPWLLIAVEKLNTDL